MFTYYDLAAVICGVAGAIYAMWRGPGSLDGSNALLGFASGSSGFLLAIMAASPFVNPTLLSDLLHSNPILLSGSLAYAAILNVRSIPGILKSRNIRLRN